MGGYADGHTEETMSDGTTTTEPAAEATAPTGGDSGTYTPPATQADLDRIIADRLSRERAKFGDYDDLKTKAAEYDKVVEANKTEAQKQADALAAALAKVQQYEAREQIAKWKDEVAQATGVPANVLAGSTKEEIEAHAATLKPLIDQAGRPQPIPGEGRIPATPLNGEGIESSLKAALGIA